MTERQVAEFHDQTLTGVGAMERFAREAGRSFASMTRRGDLWQFEDGVNVYKAVMVKGGWRILEIEEPTK